MQPDLLTRSGTRKLSEVARHVILPAEVASTGWRPVREKCRELGVGFDRWQDGAGRAILAKRRDGKYSAVVGGVALSLPRQSGKTYLVMAIVFALCLLMPNMTVLWTAHHSRTSDETLTLASRWARRWRIAPYVKQVLTGGGEGEIKFADGSRILFGSRARGFGRGFGVVGGIDIVVFDEAQILTERALTDMLPTLNQARHPAGALVIYMGTPPRPEDPSEVWQRIRLEALEAGSGKGETLYIECSADEDADPDDLEQLAKANPSYPLHTPVEAIQRLRLRLTEEDFLREAYGIWGATSTAQVIDPNSWADVADPSSMAIDRLTLGIDVAPNRSTSSVSLAGARADGLWHVEVDDTRSGTDWVIPWVVARAGKNRLHAVVVDEMSGLVETRGARHYLTGTRILVTLAGAEGRDMAIACGKFYDAVIDGSLRHTDQPHMNVALSVARKRPVAGAWAWNRKDAGSDITPLVAATLALWGATRKNVRHPLARESDAARSGRRAIVV